MYVKATTRSVDVRLFPCCLVAGTTAGSPAECWSCGKIEECYTDSQVASLSADHPAALFCGFSFHGSRYQFNLSVGESPFGY